MTNFRLADFIVLLFFAFVAASCGNKNRLDVDVSQVDVTLKVHRIDSLLLQTPYDSIESEVTEWLADYPDFMQLYGEKIIEAGKVHTAEFPIGIKAFYNYIVAGGIDTELSEVFPDLHETEQHLQEAFRHYKYHFPNAYIPQIYTYVSGVRQSVFIADGMLGISLDKYLGQQAETYARMQIERYLRKKMYKEKIAADCMQAIAVGNFAFNDSVNNLLTNMIHQGKIMYFVDARVLLF